MVNFIVFKLCNLATRNISREEARIPSPDLKAPTWHCRVLDAKFTALRLTAGGLGLENSGSFPACKAQCFICNRMLGRSARLRARGVPYPGTERPVRLEEGDPPLCRRLRASGAASPRSAAVPVPPSTPISPISRVHLPFRHALKLPEGAGDPGEREVELYPHGRLSLAGATAPPGRTR